MFGFEKLDVWVRAIEYADSIYSLTKQFPPDERFGLTNQLRRASVSISSNIAEGSGRQSNPDFCRFLRIAYGSVMECVSQLNIAKRQKYISESEFELVVVKAEELSRMLSGLKRSLEQSQ